MNRELLQRLSPITDEEARLLEGEKLNAANYSDSGIELVDAGKLLEAGKLITVRPNTRFTAFPKHSHNYIEMVYMCSGEQKHIINDDTEITLKQGELLLLGQNACHEVGFAGREDIAVNFIVLPSFFDTALEIIGSDNKLSEFIVSGLTGEGSIGYMHFNVADVLPVQNLLENLIWSLLNRQPNRRNINQVTMGLLFLNLLGCTDHLISNANEGFTNTIVVSALKEIEENYASASLTKIAKLHNVTPAYVSRIVSERTGKTFKELLKDKRLSKAAALLKSTALPIGDIIFIVGYENTSYFYRIFYEKYGLSPKQLRDTGLNKV